jgi:hypothetical protein
MVSKTPGPMLPDLAADAYLDGKTTYAMAVVATQAVLLHMFRRMKMVVIGDG